MGTTTAVAQIYSQACTRAGLAALLIASIGALSIIQSFQFDHYRAAMTYVSSRAYVANRLEHLNQDECWPDDVAARKDVTLVQLYTTACQISGGAKETLTLDRRKTLRGSASYFLAEAPTSYESDGRTPKPPQNFRSVRFNQAAEDLVSTLEILLQPEMIHQARQFSSSLDQRIYDWDILRYSMFSEAAPRWEQMFGEPYSIGKHGFLLLTIGEINELSLTAPIPISEVEGAARQFQISVPGLAQLDLTKGSALVCAVIFFLVAFFWVNHRAIVQEPGYPQPGSLFFVFRQTVVSKWLYCVIALVPAFVSVASIWRPISGSAQWLVVLPISGTVLLSAASIRLFLLSTESADKAD